MQQLLGDKTATLDKSVMRELFLQRLPSQVCMVLESTPDTSTVDELAQLADEVLEVAIPPKVSAVQQHDQAGADMAAELSDHSLHHKVLNVVRLSANYIFCE